MAPTTPSAAPLPVPPQPEKPHFWTGLRKTFLAGLAVFLPAIITLWVLLLLDKPFRQPFASVGKWVGNQDARFLLEALADVPGLGLLVALVLILLIGVVARNYLGHHLIRWANEFAAKIPVVRAIYSSVKQVSDTIFTSAGKQTFRRAVLVRFPTEHSLAIGFVTGESRGLAPGGAAEPTVNVFVPTAPNPTSGFLLMIAESRLLPLEMSVEDAFKMVVSGGVVTPPDAPGARESAAPPPHPNVPID